jgi:DUSP domain
MPGSIDNTILEQKLVIENNKDGLRKNVNFYLLSKQVWDFFLGIYGGGPTITINNSSVSLSSNHTSS